MKHDDLRPALSRIFEGALETGDDSEPSWLAGGFGGPDGRIELWAERLAKSGAVSSRGSLRRLRLVASGPSSSGEMAFIVDSADFDAVVSSPRGALAEMAGSPEWAGVDIGHDITETGCPTRCIHPWTLREMIEGNVPWFRGVACISDAMEIGSDSAAPRPTSRRAPAI